MEDDRTTHDFDDDLFGDDGEDEEDEEEEEDGEEDGEGEDDEQGEGEEDDSEPPPGMNVSDSIRLLEMKAYLTEECRCVLIGRTAIIPSPLRVSSKVCCRVGKTGTSFRDVQIVTSLHLPVGKADTSLPVVCCREPDSTEEVGGGARDGYHSAGELCSVICSGECSQA
jgi:hypothetical protein